MQKFIDYIKLQEISATNMGKSMLGGATSLSLDAKSQAAFDAVIEAFELVLGERPNVAISWLKNISSSMPEVHQKVEEILSQHDIESLKDAVPAARRAGQKISRSISRGLGDLNSSDSDVVSMNAADSFKGEGYFLETKAICQRCHAESRASRFDINAGKAKCSACGGFLEKLEKKTKNKE